MIDNNVENQNFYLIKNPQCYKSLIETSIKNVDLWISDLEVKKEKLNICKNNVMTKVKMSMEHIKNEIEELEKVYIDLKTKLLDVSKHMNIDFGDNLNVRSIISEADVQQLIQESVDSKQFVKLGKKYSESLDFLNKLEHEVNKKITSDKNEDRIQSPGNFPQSHPVKFQTLHPPKKTLNFSDDSLSNSDTHTKEESEFQKKQLNKTPEPVKKPGRPLTKRCSNLPPQNVNKTLPRDKNPYYEYSKEMIKNSELDEMTQEIDRNIQKLKKERMNGQRKMRKAVPKEEIDEEEDKTNQALKQVEKRAQRRQLRRLRSNIATDLKSAKSEVTTRKANKISKKTKNSVNNNLKLRNERLQEEKNNLFPQDDDSDRFAPNKVIITRYNSGQNSNIPSNGYCTILNKIDLGSTLSSEVDNLSNIYDLSYNNLIEALKDEPYDLSFLTRNLKHFVMRRALYFCEYLKLETSTKFNSTFLWPDDKELCDFKKFKVVNIVLIKKHNAIFTNILKSLENYMMFYIKKRDPEGNISMKGVLSVAFEKMHNLLNSDIRAFQCIDKIQMEVFLFKWDLFEDLSITDRTSLTREEISKLQNLFKELQTLRVATAKLKHLQGTV
jgi:hypothetical protein